MFGKKSEIMFRLVIAEKPSVAKSLAAVLGAANRRDGYLEGNGWLVSWCLGHLAGLADAATYNPDYAKWRYDDLPILPESWRFTIAKDKRDQFDVLRTLLRREDVTDVVNACDAGREGELIFRTVYCLAGCTKPIRRLWISSMEDSAIREGFANLRPGSDYDGLHQAALCRAKADWLVGINATRLFSVLYHRTLNIGRVMSPTLALIVQREAEIDAFKPVPFYTVALELPGFTVSGERMADKAAAQRLKTACQGATATVKKVERKEKSEKPPVLSDLTTLQRDANRLLGYLRFGEQRLVVCGVDLRQFGCAVLLKQGADLGGVPLAGFVSKHGSDLLQRQFRFGRRGGSILCLRLSAEHLCQPVSGIRNSSGSTAEFFDGLCHIAHSAHVIFLLPWICSAVVRRSGCLPVFLTPR